MKKILWLISLLMLVACKPAGQQGKFEQERELEYTKRFIV